MTQQIRTVSPIGARCIVASIYWRRNNLLSFFLLSLCLHFYQLSQSPNVYVSLSLPISISLAIAIFSISLFPRYLYLFDISISLRYTEKPKNIQNEGKKFAAFCLFMGTLPKNCGLLSGKGKTLKLKTTSKLKDKRTWIPKVRGLYRMYGTFLNSLGSHYRLPSIRVTSSVFKH
jgi:hypothetical protein